VRWKKDGVTYRQTYCAVKRDELRIHSFTSKDGDLGDVVTSQNAAVGGSDVPIVQLEVVPQNGSLEVLVTQQDGQLTMLSGDLQKTPWRGRLSPKVASGAIAILAVQWLSMSDAQKTVMKQRPDLLAGVPSYTSFLVAAFKPTTGDIESPPKLFCGVWSLGDPSRPSNSTAPLEPLNEFEIPLDCFGHSPEAAKAISCAFSSRAAQLHFRSGKVLTVYDLSGLMPRRLSTLQEGLGACHDMVALSPTLAMFSFPDSLRLYDLQFKTIQAAVDLNRVKLKRKRYRSTSDLQTGPIEFVTYFPQSARIVAKRRNQLLAIDLASTSSQTASLTTASLLVNNVGRGLTAPEGGIRHSGQPAKLSIGHVEMAAGFAGGWQVTRKRLEQLAQNDAVTEFEDEFIQDLAKSSKDLPGSLMVDDLPTASSHVPDVKVKYILSKIFKVNATSDASSNGDVDKTLQVKVVFPAFRLILWLARTGLLSIRALHAAVAISPATSSSAFGPDALAAALLEVDPTYSLLIQYLENARNTHIQEQTGTVRLLIRQALAQTERTVENGLEHTGARSQEDEGENETSILMTTPAPDPSATALVKPVTAALKMALSRFGKAASSEISSQLRHLFSQTDVLALIQFLRQQMFQGGYTRSILSLAVPSPPDSDDESTGRPSKIPEEDIPFDAMVKILSSCVDAIGPVGFFGSEDHQDFVESIIPELVSEVTRVTQSLEEAAELTGILRETLRYTESVQRHREAGGRGAHQGLDLISRPQPGSIVTLYSEQAEGDGRTSTVGILPLSLRAERAVSPRKVRKGGGQVSKRSAREVLMLESRLKGRYAFERLIL